MLEVVRFDLDKGVLIKELLSTLN